ncbi:hypothetical protein CspHIS471_0704690 [Cutaneotrichosporon sp. HIS471]|nr:hypothetical protein CspHIS471_0704690 [Cutaneotrichosporon sp. HIS471]
MIGSGAVGIQMAADLKELYPTKNVTLVQSRDRVMPKFHLRFHEFITERFRQLDIELITNSRVVLAEGGFPYDGSMFCVKLINGCELETQLVILGTGQTPNNELVRTLTATTDSLINPDNGFIWVKPTLQFADPAYPNISASRTGEGAREELSVKEPSDRITITLPALHITLGLQKSVVFRCPPPAETEPSYAWRDQ